MAFFSYFKASWVEIVLRLTTVQDQKTLPNEINVVPKKLINSSKDVFPPVVLKTHIIQNKESIKPVCINPLR